MLSTQHAVPAEFHGVGTITEESDWDYDVNLRHAAFWQLVPPADVKDPWFSNVSLFCQNQLDRDAADYLDLSCAVFIHLGPEHT